MLYIMTDKIHEQRAHVQIRQRGMLHQQSARTTSTNQKLHAYMLCKYIIYIVMLQRGIAVVRVASPPLIDRVGSGGTAAAVFSTRCDPPPTHTATRRRLHCLVSQIVLLAHLRQRFLLLAGQQRCICFLFGGFQLHRLNPRGDMGRYTRCTDLSCCCSSSPVKRAQCWSSIFASKRFRA